MSKPGICPSLSLLRTWATRAAAGDTEAADLLREGWHLRGTGFLYGIDTRASPKRAVDCFRKADALGHLPATVELARCLRDGDGTPEDPCAALGLFRRAAKQGSVEGQREYGIALRDGVATRPDRDKARTWLERAAEAEDGEALFELASMEDDGEGDRSNALLLRAARAGHTYAAYEIGRDMAIWAEDGTRVEEGVRWLRFAAEKGVDMAWWHLAERKRVGNKTDKDPGAALKLAKSGYRRTGDGGCACLAGEILAEELGRPDLGIQWLLRGARAGDSDAMVSLGCAYRYGRGTRRNLRETVRWYRAAIRVDPEESHAWSNLGLCYRNGEGVRRNLRRAFECASRAAELGHEESKTHVARALVFGRGTPRNRRKGRKLMRQLASTDPDVAWELAEWYLDGKGVARAPGVGMRLLRAAAARGSDEALCRLGVLHFNGEHVPRDRSRAATLYRKAADLGNGHAQHNLGLCYEEGKGVEKDAQEAGACFEAAVDLGSELSALKLASIYLDGDGGPPDPERAVAVLRRFIDGEHEDADVFLLLARCAFDGTGMRRNLREARELLAMARLDAVTDRTGLRTLTRDLRAATGGRGTNDRGRTHRGR